MMNTLLLSLILLLGVYFIALVARPEWVPNNRWMLAVLGVIVIVTADAWLLDKPVANVYTKDTLKIIGAFLVIT